MPSSDPLAKVNRELKKYKNLPDAGMVMGVCAGLSYRLGWPTWAVRIAFVVLVLGYGAGIIAYLAIGLIAPDAGTPDDYARRTGGE